MVDLTEGPSPQLSPVFLPKPRPKAQGKKKSELVTAESIAPEAIAKLKRNDMQFGSLTIKQMQAIGMVHFLKEPKEMVGKNKAAVAAAGPPKVSKPKVSVPKGIQTQRYHSPKVS